MSLCGQKARYKTEAKALRGLKRWQEAVERRGAGRAPTRTYKCPHCDFWHLTSQKKKQSSLRYDGLPVFERWEHPRDAPPKRAGNEIQMNPFAANELRSSDLHELLDLMLRSIEQRITWRMRKSLERIERGSKGSPQ